MCRLRNPCIMDHVVPHGLFPQGRRKHRTEHLGKTCLITVIHLHEADTLSLQLSPIALWTDSRPDLIAKAESDTHQMRADEARGTCDEDTLHGWGRIQGD